MKKSIKYKFMIGVAGMASSVTIIALFGDAFSGELIGILIGAIGGLFILLGYFEDISDNNPDFKYNYSYCKRRLMALPASYGLWSGLKRLGFYPMAAGAVTSMFALIADALSSALFFGIVSVVGGIMFATGHLVLKLLKQKTFHSDSDD